MSRQLASIIRIADLRHGLVLLDDLKALGIGKTARHRLVSEGLLRPIHRGTVFAIGEAKLDISAEILAACFAVPDSWASGIPLLNTGAFDVYRVAVLNSLRTQQGIQDWPAFAFDVQISSKLMSSK
jgi:hypothetical protein